jgi:hypothetical protein
MDCGDIDNYDKLTPDNRLDVLSDFISDWAEANDIENPPDVVSGEQPDDPATERDESESRAWYDPATNTIGFDPDFLRDGDASEALSSAGHELAHAQVRDWFGDEPDYDSQGWGEASEWYGDLFGDSYVDDMKDSCNDEPPPESPAEPDVPDEEEKEDEGDVEEEGSDEPRPPWRMPPEEEEPEPSP